MPGSSATSDRRLENLIVVEPAPPLGDNRLQLSFETLTFVPFDRRLIPAETLAPGDRDWLNAYHDELVTLFAPAKGRLPSYSTIRRTLLRVEYQVYSACLSRFFGIQPLPGETIATDGKVLRGSYEGLSDDPALDSHPAIMLVTAYIVERGLILEPYEVGSKTNEITALPAFIQQMALKGVVFAFDAISTQKKQLR